MTSTAVAQADEITIADMPTEGITFKSFDAQIPNTTGGFVFEQKDVVFPDTFSQLAVNVVASKYFYGPQGKGDDVRAGGREREFAQLVHRIAKTFADDGLRQGHFSSREESAAFYRRTCSLLLHQRMAFNSPVEFNVGLHHEYGIAGDTDAYRWVPAVYDMIEGDHQYEHVEKLERGEAYKYPQGSACFIIGVEDNMQSIGSRTTQEMMLFKQGSGAGSDNSKIRSRRERLSGGGRPSGPTSFMEVHDAVASVTKSGGKTRRAAKMESLKCFHPDIELFVNLKSEEEKIAHTLIDAGVPADFNTGAYSKVKFQNCNMSVRVTDAFLRKAAGINPDPAWQTIAVTTGKPTNTHGERMPTLDAVKLVDDIARGAWFCADPGLQYEDEIQRWHTCPNTAPINASNPCSEYMHIDDSACNLASINLMKYRTTDDNFDVGGFREACDATLTSQDILVDLASYPSAKIAENAHRFRQLGLGYANLGALIMSYGLAYDSDEGRLLCKLATALMQAQAYLTSAWLAKKLGAFAGYEANKEPMLRVVGMHAKAGYAACDEANAFAGTADQVALFNRLSRAVRDAWCDAVDEGRRHGYRNSQVTVLAPTGTIAFMMDCDTTGIEPDTALVKYKNLAGGGQLKIVNQTVPLALKKLGYSDARFIKMFSESPRKVSDSDLTVSEIDQIVAYIDAHDTIEGCPILKPEHLSVFDCAFEPPQGGRSIAWEGHVRMMAAAQPSISGAISKCVTGDTLVVTEHGLRRIDSFYTDNGGKPDTFSPLHNLKVATGDGTLSQATEFYYGGYRPTWKVTLADGRTITGTEPHRLRIATPAGLDWKALPDLQPGDFVGLCLGSERWGHGNIPFVRLSLLYGCQHTITIPARVDADLGLFLGMLTADGHVTASNYTVGFTKDDQAARDKFKALLKSLFGLEAHAVDDERRDGGPDGNTGVVVGCKSLMEWLAGIGWSKEHVPTCILEGTREGALGYLAGLYLDGYITKIDDVAIGQKYRSLLLDVQALWDNLGVATYFTDNVVDGTNYPVLHALGSSRRRMADLIAWIEPHKMLRSSLLNNGEDRRPFPLKRPALESAIRDAHATQQFRSIFDKRTAVIGRRCFLEAAEAVGLELELEEKNLHYVPVVSVEYAGEQEVFDISVPGPEAFVANGIVNHNTINMPNSATVEDIKAAYFLGWELKLKALSVYRDGCKRSQPLNTKKDDAPAATKATVVDRTEDSGAVIDNLVDECEKAAAENAVLKGDNAALAAKLAGLETRLVGLGTPYRKKLPKTRKSVTHHFKVDNHDGYFTVSFFPDDGQPAELFITMAKEGSTVGGLMDVIGTQTSFLLQYGAPLEVLVNKFAFTRFEPSGFTGNPDIPLAKSLIDYIFRWLGMEFIPGYKALNAPQRGSEAPEPETRVLGAGDRTTGLLEASPADRAGSALATAPPPSVSGTLSGRFRTSQEQAASFQSDAPACDNCGALTIRCGTCYRCSTCGNSMGCS